MDSLCLEQLDFDQRVSDLFDMDFLNPWIAYPPTNDMIIESLDDPLPIKQSAPKETDWAEKKPTIEHIYLNENQTLNATMACMREQHGFTATEKMYKRHFRLWGWYKYTTKTLRREKQFRHCEPDSTSSQPGVCEPPRKKKRIHEDQCTSSKAALLPTPNLLSVDFKSFQEKATIFMAIKQLFESYTRTSISTQSPSACSFSLLRNSSGPRLLDGLFEALNASDCDAKLGREAIDKTFDQVQYHIRENDITSLIELCFLIPRALLFSSQRRALRSYLSRLMHTLQERNIQGPFAQVGGLLQDVYKSQKESGLLDLLVFAAGVFAAVLVDRYGKDDRKTLLASWDSLRVAGHLKPDAVSTWLDQWESLHEGCMSRFGRHGLQTLGLEDDLAGLLQPTRLYPQTSCPAEIGGLINGVRRKLFLIPSEESGRSSFEEDNRLFLC